ncbi:MAG: bifunctional phosphoribosylaminoimidazolecarboxamide formyltransferase/IMP cyclohydrolase [Candidatus Kapaibacteriales bacterium]
MNPNDYQIQNAIISVYNKNGVLELARELVKLGIKIYSTGGTQKYLEENQIPTQNIIDLTAFPEILDGRVKTLHPAIYAGILYRRDIPEHIEQLQKFNISPIDLVICNLYPFEETLKTEHNAQEIELLEMIDIGGPSMLRASAKNYYWCIPVVNPERYFEIIEILKANNNKIPLEIRKTLSAEAFEYINHYDNVISEYFNIDVNKTKRKYFNLSLKSELKLRYGENPHQKANLFGDFLTIFEKLHGKELSYNNILDIDSAGKLILEFEEPTVAIIKHTNPCGVGSAKNITEAYRKAFATDTISPFGGIIITNRTIDIEFAHEVHPLFTEVIIAPEFEPEALELLTKKKDRRLIRFDANKFRKSLGIEFRSVTSGVLVQEVDLELYLGENFRIVTNREPTDDELRSMIFAWKVVKHTKSNAIVYATIDRTLGIGAGQMSRVDSSRIAVEKARAMGLDLTGSAVASDAFFPFPDGIIESIKAGSTAVIQPGGSVRDEEVIATANQYNIAMVFTGMRHFKH